MNERMMDDALAQWRDMTPEDAEIHALKADNAALLEVVDEHHGSCPRCWLAVTQEPPHPGAALLEQLRKQQGVISALTQHLDGVLDCIRIAQADMGGNHRYSLRGTTQDHARITEAKAFMSSLR